jgi:UDP-glucose 4-epimerase
MTRFLLSLDDAVDVIFAAVREARAGETYIPRVPSAKVMDIAKVLVGDRAVEIKVTGIRPGEKVHEILISDEESYRTVDRGKYYAIASILPELVSNKSEVIALKKEYSSEDNVMDPMSLKNLLSSQGLLVEHQSIQENELLR